MLRTLRSAQWRGLQNRGPSLRQRNTLRAWQVVLDDDAFERLHRRNPVRRARVEFVVKCEHHAVFAGRENRALERRVGKTERADAVLRRYRTRADEASIDIQLRDGLHGARI